MLDDARRIMDHFVERYNGMRLHDAIGYIIPLDKLHGREQEIFDERDQKLEAARRRRAEERPRQRERGT